MVIQLSVVVFCNHKKQKMDLIQHNGRNFPRKEAWRDVDAKKPVYWLPLSMSRQEEHVDTSFERGTLLFETCGTPWPEEGQVVTITHPNRPQGRSGEVRSVVARTYATRAVEAFARDKPNADANSRTWIYQNVLDSIETTWNSNNNASSARQQRYDVRLRVLSVWSCPPEISKEMGSPERSAFCEDPTDAVTWGSTVVCVVLAQMDPPSWNTLTELFDAKDIAHLPVMQAAFLQVFQQRMVANSAAAAAAAGAKGVKRSLAPATDDDEDDEDDDV